MGWEVITEIIASWLFDLLGLAGTILTVWPIIGISHKKARQDNTAGHLASRDTSEIVPQVKWSWTGVILLTLSVLSKLGFQLISSSKLLTCPALMIAIAFIFIAILVTLVLRLIIINRYWSRYDRSK